MAKLGNPFGKGNRVFITQTYHGSANTAIDCYGATYQANLPVYAIADGQIIKASTGSGSWCALKPDNSDITIWYVHVYNWLKIGTRVKKGQRICEIAPKSKNGGYPEHLHLGLTPKGEHFIMNYFDRVIPFRTKYSDIKRSWFKGDGTLDWSKFKDLSYTNNIMGKVSKGKNYEFTNSDKLNVRDKPNGGLVLQLPENKKAVALALTDGVKDGDFIWNLYAGCGWGGWMAENWSKETSRKVTDINGKDVTVSDCSKQEQRIQELEQGIKILEEEITPLRMALRASEEGTRLALERVELLEANLEEREKELQEIEIAYDRVKDERDRFEAEKNELLMHGTLASATTGEIFAEIWRRITRSIK
jgi:hypothetical protein